MSVSYQPYQPPASVPEELPAAGSSARLDVRRVFRESLATFRAHAVGLTFAFLLLEVVGFVLGFGVTSALVAALGEQRATYVSYLTCFAVTTFLGIGNTRMLLDVARGKPLRIRTMFSGIDAFFFTLVASLLQTIAVVAGFLALVVPGVILSLAFSFTTILIADRGTDPLVAIRESMRLTRRRKFSLFALGLLCCLVLLGGLLALLVGILPALAFTQLPLIHAYLQATGES
jgi:uncharacterized membrane protein